MMVFNGILEWLTCLRFRFRELDAWLWGLPVDGGHLIKPNTPCTPVVTIFLDS